MEENKTIGRDASRSKDSLAQKEWEVAWNFVNKTAGNKTAAYRQYYIDNEIDVPKSPQSNAIKFFERERVKQLVSEFREENRKTYDFIRDENIASLRDIASSLENKNTDRIAAVKELNHMLGLGQENINLDTNTITIELID